MKFTKEEKIAIIFVLVSLFLGTGVLYYKKVYPALPQNIEINNIKKEKININMAPLSALIKLNRVGPVLAERIMAYREKYGPFRRKEDIKKVKGIGAKTYEKIKEEITVK